MKTILWIAIAVLTVCVYVEDVRYRKLDSLSHLPGDFRVERGIGGELGKAGRHEFFFKYGIFKLPDEYNFGYDSIEILLGWDSAPIVNPCYYKTKKADK